MQDQTFIKEILERLSKMEGRFGKMEGKQDTQIQLQRIANGSILENKQKIDKHERRLNAIDNQHSYGKINWTHIAVAIIIGGVVVAAGLNLREFVGNIL